MADDAAQDAAPVSAWLPMPCTMNQLRAWVNQVDALIPGNAHNAFVTTHENPVGISMVTWP